MPTDNRDWYRDRGRARDRYKERALFRLSHREAHQRRRLREWRNRVFGIVLCLVLLVVALRFLRSVLHL